jgi:transposase
MSGTFNGLTDAEWKVMSIYIPEIPYKGIGRLKPDRRALINTIMYVLITGCRWCDIPVGEKWSKRSTAHEWLGIWSRDGTMKNLRQSLQSHADLQGMLDWKSGSVDGSFSPR